MIRYVVPPDQSGHTIEYVASHVLGLSHGMLSRMKFSGGIRVDGVTRRSTQVLAAGQVLTLTSPDKHLPPPAFAVGTPCIVFEDAHYLAVDKPAPLASLDSSRGGETLQGQVYNYLGGGGFIYRPVNRLDKGTSGLMLIAKSAHSQFRAQRLLHTHAFRREYLAITVGTPAEKQGVIRLPIGHGEGVRREISPFGRESTTWYQVMEEYSGLSLLRLRLETGRTHQIRVHLSALGCPVLGDYVYGQADDRLPGRFALHACLLAFVHPFTGNEILLQSLLPEPLRALLRA